MEYILLNPLPTPITIFSGATKNEYNEYATWSKSEIKVALFEEEKYIKNDKNELVMSNACFLSKTKPRIDDMILLSTTAETDPFTVETYIIKKITGLRNHNNVIEGYEVWV